MIERRAVARKKSYLQGRILYNHRQSSLDCVIRDITDRGARLKFSEAITIPDAIELYIPNREEAYRAKVRWRIGDEAGVDFGTPPSAARDDASADLAGRVRSLEDEVATLHRMFSELKADIRRLKAKDD